MTMILDKIFNKPEKEPTQVFPYQRITHLLEQLSEKEVDNLEKALTAPVEKKEKPSELKKNSRTKGIRPRDNSKKRTSSSLFSEEKDLQDEIDLVKSQQLSNDIQRKMTGGTL